MITPAEATTILSIARTADGGCRYCAQDIVARLVEAFPDTDWHEAAKGLADPEDYPSVAMMFGLDEE